MKFAAFAMTILVASNALAVDLSLLQNDKEVVISAFSHKEKERISALYRDEHQNRNIQDIFYQSVQDYLQSENLKCEMRLPHFFEHRLFKANLAYAPADIQDHLKMLRVTNAIDDLLYEATRDVATDLFAIRSLDEMNKRETGISAVKAKLLAVNDIDQHYDVFKSWPDENTNCVYQEYVHLKNIIFNEKNQLSKDTNDFKYLTGHALHKKIISDATFRKLEYLRTKSAINKRELWLQDYFKIVFNAKNKMVPVKKIYLTMNFDRENKFSTERATRKEKLTRRKLLYLKYDETQIIQLAQVLQRASRRMGTDPDTKSSAPVISQQFDVTLKDGNRQTYVERHVLDPQSQFNYARRMLRKDILAIQMMDSYKKLQVTYEDVVMAAFETGYVSFEDLEFVVNYDDLWNSKKTRFQKVMGFIFDVSGYTTFFLPAPWNIAASIALGIAEGAVDKKFDTGEDHDNPATFIE